MSMLNLNIGVRGKMRASVLRQGVAVQDSGWFDNLILDQGLDLMASNASYANNCQVGSGSTEPAVGQVQLVNRIAGQVRTSSVIGQINTAERYAYFRITYLFAVGAATGNISEVGIGTATSGTTLFSRALIKDPLGEPTTITVLADEQLKVEYELRVYQPTADVFSGDVGGYAVVARAALANSATAAGWFMPNPEVSPSANSRLVFRSGGGNDISVRTGAIAGITGQPAGSQIYYAPNLASVATDVAYVPGSFYRDVNILLPAAVANNAAGIGAFMLSLGPAVWQIGFTPNIMKTVDDQLTATLRFTWSRRVI